MNSSFYQVNNNEIKIVRDRCREFYGTDDFVMVLNIDTQPYTYFIQRPENVSISQPSSVTKELYYTKDPDVVTMQPGETRLVPGYEADAVIEGLMKKIVHAKRQVILDKAELENSHIAPTESVMDPTTQYRYVRAIFQGKKNFIDEFNQQKAVAQAAYQSPAALSSVESDLNIDAA